MDQRIDRPESQTLGHIRPSGAALALRWAGPAEPSIDAEARAFFDERTELIQLRKAQLYERRWKDRLSLALQALGVVVAAAAVLTAAAMIWSARADRGLVIEPFSVPPDLAARGLTGQVVASQLLDKLSSIQSQTASSRPANSYRNNWGDHLMVDSPQTGVSTALDRWLHSHLSQRIQVTGEVFETPQGLSVTARTGEGGDSFAGGSADLDKLMQQSAEAIYRRAQPYRYAVYLMTSGRMDQGVDLLTKLGNGAVGPDRVWANSVLGELLVARGDTAAGLARNLDAVTTAPQDPHAWANLASSLNALGHAEGALAAARKSDILLRRHPSAEAADPRAVLTANQASLAEAVGDFQAAATWEARATVLPGSGDGGTSRAQAVADVAAAHDPAASDTARAVALFMKVPDIVLLPPLLEADLALGRYPTAVRDGEALQGVAAQPTSFQAWLERGWVLRVELAKLAFATAMVGDPERAQALIASTPLDCYDCVRMRGRIAAAGRDWLQAEHWFGQATRLAPSLPFAWTDWGRMRLAMGDPAGAIKVLQIAHQKGPRFADPLELWGEALLAKRDYAGAAEKFAEAAHDAPAWGGVHLLWGKALMASGRRGEARAQFETANGLDLSRSDRAALGALLERAASDRRGG